MNPSSPQPLPLRDIHLPEAIGLWPLAPGWWLLLGAVLLLLGILAYTLYRRRQPTALKQALARLDQVMADDRLALHQKSQEISKILKQMALTVGARNEVAELSGHAWIEWIGSRPLKVPLSETVRGFLELGPYRRDAEVTPAGREALASDLRIILIGIGTPASKKKLFGGMFGRFQVKASPTVSKPREDLSGIRRG